MSKLLYIRGEPGSGKHTVGRIAAEMLGWEYLWFHQLYREPSADPVAIARLVLPGLAKRLARGRNLIFTRPSRLRSTVAAVVAMAEAFGYEVRVVRLTAGRETLLQRVRSRKAEPWRVSDDAGLDRYLADGGAEEWSGEQIVATDGMTPEQVAEAAMSGLR